MTDGNEEWRQASAPGLRFRAEEYLQVGRDSLELHRSRLRPNQRHHTLVPFAIYYNFLHSVELSLKAYMVHSGSNLKELRSVGHNLGAALDLCIERGLREVDGTISDLMIEVLSHANSMYSSKDFEYIRIGGTQLAHIDQIASAAEALQELISRLDMRPSRPQYSD